MADFQHGDAKLQELAVMIDGIAKYGQGLIQYARVDPEQLKEGLNLQETLTRFTALTGTIEQSLQRFEFALAESTNSSLAYDYPTQFSRLKQTGETVVRTLRSLIPSTLSLLTSSSLSVSHQKELLKTFILKLKGFSGEVTALRNVITSLSEELVAIDSLSDAMSSMVGDVTQANDQPTPPDSPHVTYSPRRPNGPSPRRTEPRVNTFNYSHVRNNTAPRERVSMSNVDHQQAFALKVASYNQNKSARSSPAKASPRPQVLTQSAPRARNATMNRSISTPHLVAAKNTNARMVPTRPSGRPVAPIRSNPYQSVTPSRPLSYHQTPKTVSAPSMAVDGDLKVTRSPQAPVSPTMNRSTRSESSLPSFFMASQNSLSTYDPLSPTVSPTGIKMTPPNSPSPRVSDLVAQGRTQRSTSENLKNDRVSSEVSRLRGSSEGYTRGHIGAPSLPAVNEHTERNNRNASSMSFSPVESALSAEEFAPPSAPPTTAPSVTIRSSKEIRKIFEATFEKALQQLFETTQKIAGNFAVLGKAMQSSATTEARDCLDDINHLSHDLLELLSEFKRKFVNDPLLISSFSSLVSKFEFCAVNFYATSNRLFSQPVSTSGQLQLSASTRSFSAGISGLLEFLVREKNKLMDSQDAKDQETTHGTKTAAAPAERKPSLRRVQTGGDKSSPKPPSLANKKSLGWRADGVRVQSMRSKGGSLLGSARAGNNEGETENDEVDPIWLEPENEDTIVYTKDEKTGKTLVKNATLNQLLIHLTHETRTDMEYMKTFLSTYQSFCTPEILIQKLLARYRVPKSLHLSVASIKVVRLRVINAFKIWLRTRFDDFTSESLSEVWSFISILRSEGPWESASKGLAKLIEQQMDVVMKRNAEEESSYSTSISPSMPMGESFSSTDFLFRVDPTVIAQHLTLIEYSIWKKLRPAELMNQNWTKAKTKHLSPHVVELTQRFNSVSHWVCSVMLWSEKLSERVKVLTKLIEIAEALDNINNFNSLLEILAGFGDASVHRLKFTFGELSRRHQRKLEELRAKMDSAGSFKAYRANLRNCNPPTLPYLGVYLSQLVFIDEGNGNTAKNGLINFGKRRLMYNTLREIEQYQMTQYSFPVVPAVNSFLSELPHNDSDELFRLSLLREPRGTESKKDLR